MRKLKLLMMALALIVGGSRAWAYQTPTDNGVYYIQNVKTGKFVNYGWNYGARFFVDDYGTAWKLIADNTNFKIQAVASEERNFQDDTWMYADGGDSRIRSYTISSVAGQDGAYTLTNTTNSLNVYVYLKEDVDKYFIAGNAIKGDNYTEDEQTYWRFLSQAERDAYIAAQVHNTEAAVLANYGLTLPAETTLSAYLASSKDFKQTNVDVAAMSTWTWTTASPGEASSFVSTSESGYSEVYQGDGTDESKQKVGGTLTKQMTGLTAGLYMVTLPALYRFGTNETCYDNEKEYEYKGLNGGSYFSAGGNAVPLATWASSCSSKVNPNWPSEFKTIVDNGGYKNVTFAHVTGTTLDLKVCVPGSIVKGWFVTGQATAIRYDLKNLSEAKADFVSGDEANADTWYAIEVGTDGYYKISSTVEASIYYSQDGSQLVTANFSHFDLAASGQKLLYLTAGQFYFKSSATSTIKIEALSGTDVTAIFITNPSFETGNFDGWTNQDDAFSIRSGSDLAGKDGTYYAFNNTSTTRALSQNVEHLVEGKYVLSVRAHITPSSGNYGTATLEFGSNSTPIPCNIEESTYNVAFDAAADASSTIRFNKNGVYSYRYFDNFILTYYSTLPDVSITDLTSETMSGDVRASLRSAHSAYTSSKTVANYNALQTAIVNAKVSIAEYATKAEAADANWTGIIQNPSFETNGYTGWTVSVASGESTGEGGRSKDGGLGTNGGSKRFFIWQSTPGSATISQTVKNLPSGTYKLSAYVASSAGSSFTLSAGITNNSLTVTNGDATLIEVYFTQAEAGDLAIKFTNTASWFDLDNFQLTKNPSWPELTAVEGIMNATVASTQTSAISTYNDAKNVANLNAALNAIAAAKTSVANYTAALDILNAASSLDAAGQASYAANETVAAIQTAYDARTLTAVTNDQKTACSAAYITAVKAQTTENTDMTEVITNPSFESATASGQTTMTGWTNGDMQTQGNNSFDRHDGNYYVERWHPVAKGTKSIKQELTGLHGGVYMLKAAAYVGEADNGKVYAKVGETEYNVAVTTSNDYMVIFNYDGTSTLEIGFSADMTEGTGWICVDNFRLVYVGASLPVTITKVTGTLYEGAKNDANNAIDAYEAAIATYNSEQTADNYAAAVTAYKDAQEKIAIAEESRSVYASVTAEDRTAYRNKIKAVLDNTNIYTTEAYNKWYAEVESNYSAGVYTNDEVQTLTESGAYTNVHKSANRIDEILLSAWKFNGEQCSDFTKNLYVNTWSVEGDTDGSEFSVPFYEYWTDDAASLGAATLTSTITGLEANTEYSVEVWARVRQANGQTKADNSITMQVGSGSAIDLTAGTQVGTSQFYLDHYTAVSTTDGEGTLTITISVAADSKISWLSFKNMKYVRHININENTAYDNSYAGTANVTLNRTIKNGGTWNSFVVPFDIANAELIAAFGVDVAVAEFSEEAASDGVNSKISFNIMETPAVTANKPVLLRTSTAGTTYYFQNRNMVSATEAKIEGSHAFDFVGSYAASTTIEEGDYYISSNKIYRSKGLGSSIKGTRAYIKAKDAGSGARVNNFFIDEETTAIVGLEIENAEQEGKIYNLNGQQVEMPRKGLYIQKGKKIVK